MSYLVYLVAICIFTLLDQLSKKQIVNYLKLGEKIEIIKGFFNITHVRNYGAGFSILQNARAFLIAVPILASIFLFYILLTEKNKSKLASVSYIFIILRATNFESACLSAW